MVPEDPRFMYEVDQEFRKGDYVVRKLVVRGIFLLVIMVIIGFAIKMYSVKMDRKIFKESEAYTEAAAQFLAKEYKEYNEAESDDDQEAIMNYVAMRYPNLNPDNIDNHDLRNFYEDCVS